jgi:hypothetical protein
MNSDLVLIATHDSINVKLSQDEINERAVQSVMVAGEFDLAEAEFKAEQKEWKKRLEAIESRLKTLRRTVESGEEFREVDCHRSFDLSRGMTWLVFEGQRYLERPCSSEELELARGGNIFEETPE